MPIWLWVSIFAAIFIVGVCVLLYLLLGLRSKAQGVQLAIEVLKTQANDLNDAASTRSEYQAPRNNLNDDPVATTQAWLKRRNASERKKAERQRRLIKRLSNRK